MKLPRVSGAKVVRAPLRAGFREAHVRSSHHFLHHPVTGRIVTVPVHSGGEIAPKTLLSILTQAEMTVEEFAGFL